MSTAPSATIGGWTTSEEKCHKNPFSAPQAKNNVSFDATETIKLSFQANKDSSCEHVWYLCYTFSFTKEAPCFSYFIVWQISQEEV